MFKSAILASVVAITTRAINLDTENQLELYAKNDLDLNNAIDAASSDDSSSNSGRPGRARLNRGLAKGGLRLGNGGRNIRRGSSSSDKHRWQPKAPKARAPPKAPAPLTAPVEVEQEELLNIEPYLKIEPYRLPKLDFDKVPDFVKVQQPIRVQAVNDIDAENADEEVDVEKDMPALLKKTADSFDWVFGLGKDDEQVVAADEQVVGAGEQEGDEVNGTGE